MTGAQSASPDLLEQLQQHLNMLLPAASAQDRKDLARAVLYPGQGESSALIDALLTAGCRPEDIQRALTRLRDFAMQQLLLSVVSQVTQDTVGRLQAFLSHSDSLQQTLLQRVGERHSQEMRHLHSQLISEGQAHLLTKARHAWRQSKGVTLYNYYQELQVSAYVPLYKVEPHGLITGRSRELANVITAGEHGHAAHIMLPEGDYALRMIVEDATARAVHWRYAGLIEVSREKRRELRVKVDSSTFIVLRHGGHEWRGRVEEFSLNGFGIALPLAEGIYREQRLDYTLIMHMNEFDGRGTLRWLTRNGSAAHAGLEIDFDPLVHAFLEDRLARRRQAILGELRIRGMPDVLI